jgi:CRISPR-associated protein Cmr3
MNGSPIALLLLPRGPIVVRDGRPFSATPGARAESLSWPYPGTVAGALRTSFGNELGWDWQSDGPDRARAVAVQGPLPVARYPDKPWQVYLPAPRDALVARAAPEGPVQVHALRPWLDLPAGAGCDLPHEALRPLHVPVAAKPEPPMAFWPLDAVARWLARTSSGAEPLDAGLLSELPREARVHVAIDTGRDAALQGALFVTEGLAFADGASDDNPARAMLCRVAPPPGWQARDGFVPLGGERRLVQIQVGGAAWPELPGVLRGALAEARRLRLLLATPAIFARGWRPGWLDDALEGSPPDAPDLRLRLVSVALGRRGAVSGWDMARGKGGRAKAARFLAPAGSVYFFEIVHGDPAASLGALWLASLCDAPQDRADGYGMAVPGVW